MHFQKSAAAGHAMRAGLLAAAAAAPLDAAVTRSEAALLGLLHALEGLLARGERAVEGGGRVSVEVWRPQ